MKTEELERLVDTLYIIKDRYKKETWTNPMSLDILRHDLEEYDLEYNKWFLIKDLVYAFLLN
jgi:hypothetical protein